MVDNTPNDKDAFRYDVFEQASRIIDAIDDRHGAMTCGLGTLDTDERGQHTFAEVWWPGYVRQPMAQFVTWVMPSGFEEDTTIGRTRRVNARVELMVNAQALFRRDGTILLAGHFGHDRWVGGGDKITVE